MAQPVVQTKSRSVLGATELTLVAPLKRGLIPALDSRSYRSRAKLVLDTLHALGVSRREIDPTPLITEVADTIKAIRSFRIAIVGERQSQPQPQVLLSVSFDGGWEPYMRRIWRPLGPLLDLIFCNCEGYLLSSSHGFPAYAAWVRQAQVETGFYYEDSPLTVWDQDHLKRLSGQPDPAPPAQDRSLYDQARAAMVAFYRLTDMHPDQPGSDDGIVLLRAARLLLGELSEVVKKEPPSGFLRTATEKAAWKWFGKDLPPIADDTSVTAINRANVQAGILEPHPGVQRGRVVLVGLDDAAAVVRFIEFFKGDYAVTPAAPPFRAVGPLFVNLAFTYAGLVQAGVDRGTLEQLPHEFREGMAARAGILGDWEHNHPQHWKLPQRFGGKQTDRVQLSTVHAVVNFWLPSAHPDTVLDNAVTELTVAVKAPVGQLTSAAGRVLAVQDMQRMNGATGATEGHFGFADGISQPRLDGAADGAGPLLKPGDLLLGYANTPGDKALEGRLWSDSTFLVVRKLRQDVKAFRDLNLSDDAKAHLMGRHANGNNLIDQTPGNDFDYSRDSSVGKCPLYAHVRRANPRTPRKNELDHLPRIMRRGMSYGPPYGGNDDEEDRGLMFMAYNASIAEQFEVVQEWLAGGNSSGPGSFSGLRDPFVGVARAGDPRRYGWEGGSGGSVMLPADRPLVTLEWGLYAFAPSISALKELHLLAGERAAEDQITDMIEPPDSADRDALQRKRDRRNRVQAAQAAAGSALIARLQQVEQALGFDAAVDQWKIALEDMSARMSGASQAIWTAVREAHGGALRTPYGVLVCKRTMVDEVLMDTQNNYTVSGYNARLAKSFGEIYLGRDKTDKSYGDEADTANAAIMAVTEKKAFESAYRHTRDLLDETLKSLQDGDKVVDVRDLVDGALARFCQEWFGLPDGQFVQPGGWHWRDEATCPGHFHAPSRYTFQPQPGAQARKAGEDHGKLLKKQVLAFVKAIRPAPARQGKLGAKLFEAFPRDAGAGGNADDPDRADERLASTLIGVMMGFLPTVDGNLRGALYEWVSNRSLWDHQIALRDRMPVLPADDEPAAPYQRAVNVLQAPLAKTMQLRPVPEVVWRTALREATLGPVQVRAGDTVVVSIVSATQEELLNERPSPFIVFGGNRPVDSDRRADPYPTHACPGYKMAMGVMLGFLAGLMETVQLRPTSSPMALRIGPL